MKSKYAPILLGNAINFMAYLSPKNAAKMALNLFRTPMAGQLKPYQKEFLAYAESKELFLGKDKIQTYQWKGTKDRVLLMHGWQSNSARWHFLIPKLQEKQYDIISMDAPAHGASGGRYFDAYQYALMQDEVVKYFNPKMIIGHSIGGFTALYHKTHFESEGIKKIIALGPPNKLVDLTAVFVKLLRFNAKTLEAYNKAFTTYFEKEQEYYNAEDFVKSIDIPGCVIHDRNDPMNPYTDGVAIANNWKDCELHITSRAGHALQSEEVFGIILSALEDRGRTHQ